MSRQQKDSHELTVKEVSTTLKDTSADLEFLMVQLGVPLSHVRHLLITSPSSDGVLVKCLDYWLKRSEDPKWEDVIKALEGSGDNNLASRIRRKILQSGDTRFESEIEQPLTPPKTPEIELLENII